MSLNFELSPEGWIDGLPGPQRTIIEELLHSGQTEEQIAEMWLSQAGAGTTSGFGTNGPLQSFYKNVLREVVAFVCDDTKYAAEREEANNIWTKQGKIGLISFVAVLVGTKVGLASAAIMPVIALIFSALAKMTKNAFCATFSQA